ncbi:hypothetical protein F4779DRAFT_532869 [Xylariaceae sp. FL0662B]|nr:hypothetical protein F4779DRAFT_532869 [Xylariaceae sp. FL0662B]
MATATYVHDTHDVPRRESSPRPRNSSGDRRRPRLLRACATEPSITTSNACKGVLTTPNTSRRATELLSRVAISNANSSPSSARSFGLESAEAREHRLSEAAHGSNSACYFSFPSFDTWEVEQRPDEEKTIERPA